jgi:3-phenylpropionate/cinnamic acid dioxygenase small subunit
LQASSDFPGRRRERNTAAEPRSQEENMSASAHPPAEATPSHRAIENLIARYAELVDDGDFAGLGSLLADATFIGSGEPVSGAEAITRTFRDTLIVHADGTPRTHHVVSNIGVEVDERNGWALARSYVTVFQSLPDLPLQPIAAGRYQDRFELRAGRWRFTERRVVINHVGDVSRHLRRP